MYYVVLFIACCFFVLVYRGIRLLWGDSGSREIVEGFIDENLSTWRSIRPLAMDVLLAYAVCLLVNFIKGKNMLF